MTTSQERAWGLGLGGSMAKVKVQLCLPGQCRNQHPGSNGGVKILLSELRGFSAKVKSGSVLFHVGDKGISLMGSQVGCGLL